MIHIIQGYISRTHFEMHVCSSTNITQDILLIFKLFFIYIIIQMEYFSVQQTTCTVSFRNDTLTHYESVTSQLRHNLTWMHSTVKAITADAIINSRPLVKSAYQKKYFLISQPKHMLWVLKRTVFMRRFF